VEKRWKQVAAGTPSANLQHRREREAAAAAATITTSKPLATAGSGAVMEERASSQKYQNDKKADAMQNSFRQQKQNDHTDGGYEHASGLSSRKKSPSLSLLDSLLESSSYSLNNSRPRSLSKSRADEAASSSKRHDRSGSTKIKPASMSSPIGDGVSMSNNNHNNANSNKDRMILGYDGVMVLSFFVIEKNSSHFFNKLDPSTFDSHVFRAGVHV
jgi:hypothetical protein